MPNYTYSRAIEKNAATAWVIYHKVKGRERYWTGKLNNQSNGRSSDDIRRALEFDTARAAYTAADEHDFLQDWRVGLR